MSASRVPTHFSSFGFPLASAGLEDFGLKCNGGGTHISRTIMLTELESLLAAVPQGSPSGEYRDAILLRNVLSKTTDSTRQKTLRHLRELYSLDEKTPIFGLLRNLHALGPASLPLLALQVAWCRDKLLRATTPAVLDASEGDLVVPASLAATVETAFPHEYSENSRGNVSRNAGSTWTQSGHLVGRGNKVRRRVKPTPVAVTLALFLGNLVGYHGAAVFANPWCRLLDLDPDRAKSMAMEAHRAGLLNLRSVGEVVELSFPMFAEFQIPQS
ncbi:MAG: hypothetical protein WED15_08910 [Akkermansiaceae bacterium]